MKPKSKRPGEKPIVQTVKINQALFERLKLFGAETLRSNQDILHSALVEYLNTTRP